jgi:hypothetical protein
MVVILLKILKNNMSIILKIKFFKTVADQAANMKKALKDVLESTTIKGGASDDNIQHLTQSSQIYV